MTIILRDTDFIISNVSVKQTTPNFYTESLNYIGNAQSRGLHRTQIKFDVTIENSADMKKFNALMLRIRGRLNPFKLELSPEEYYNPLYTNVRSCKLVNQVDIGNNKIVLAGFSGAIPAGSVFQFPNDDKLYTLLDDASSNKVAEIFPACRQLQVQGGSLNFNPSPLLRLRDDEFEVQYENATTYKFETIEVL